MAFVAGAEGGLVAYKCGIGRRYFWVKILNFWLGFEVDDVENEV
jgi:hypothetical protein